jgi:hypothetical protein
MATYETQPTPNPNSVKITTEAGTFISSGMESFSSPEEAENHPLGRSLFAVPGVTNVFLLPHFLTITKAPAADWNRVMAGVQEALDTHFSE